tara:strand:+ start:1681 stop:2103 length:423 start_codon:yes stop_codon:yes gene_type:complete
VSRPLYETRLDRSKEINAIEKFIENFGGGAGYVKLPIQYKMDFCVTRNDYATSFVEVKCRNNKMEAYPTYMISLSKILSAAQYRDFGINCILLVQWTDKMGWVRMPNKEWLTKVGGRKDRGDWQDVEPVAHIPVSEFKVI